MRGIDATPNEYRRAEEEGQRHVEEEMERRAREHTAAPELAYFAEEYAEVAMRGIDATPNEYRRAEEEGQRHGTGDTSGNLADASDIAGG